MFHMKCYFFIFEKMFFEKKMQCLVFSKNYKKKKKNVVYCNLTFKVSHLALDNMNKHCALDNMNLISTNARR